MLISHNLSTIEVLCKIVYGEVVSQEVATFMNFACILSCKTFGKQESKQFELSKQYIPA